MEPRIIERADHPVSRSDIDRNVLRVLYRLIEAGHIAYLVGGSVRDLMLGRRPKDFDIATSAHPQQVRDLFRNSRLIGRRFRLVHVFFGAQNIEVATFRRHSEEVDENDPMIRRDNTFGTPEEDAFRRDFTINSLFYDPSTFRVIDYTGGADDLRARLIRTIGEPEIRMREDPVRMMRAVRFAAKLNFELEPGAFDAIERHREDLRKASVPRLVEETYRTLGQPAAAQALILMERLGLLSIVMPWLSEHLRLTEMPLEQTPTARNLCALGREIEGGLAPAHGLVLACLMFDFARAEARQGAEAYAGRFDLLAALRSRGFARADTEHMRLMLDAVMQIISRGRRIHRLARRPYFAQARRLFEMTAADYGADPKMLEQLLSAGDHRPAPPHRAARSGEMAQFSTGNHFERAAPPGAGANGALEGAVHRRRRRRRRRGGRGRGPAQTGAVLEQRPVLKD